MQGNRLTLCLRTLVLAMRLSSSGRLTRHVKKSLPVWDPRFSRCLSQGYCCTLGRKPRDFSLSTRTGSIAGRWCWARHCNPEIPISGIVYRLQCTGHGCCTPSPQDRDIGLGGGVPEVVTPERNQMSVTFPRGPRLDSYFQGSASGRALFRVSHRELTHCCFLATANFGANR